MTQDELSTIGKIIWQHLTNAGLTGSEDCATSQALKAVEMAAAEITSGADQRIAELQAKLRAWEETAEHYCKDNTPISPDGVRGYIAELEAQLAAKDARIQQLEAYAAYWEAEAQGNASAELETYRAAMSGELTRYKTP